MDDSQCSKDDDVVKQSVSYFNKNFDPGPHYLKAVIDNLGLKVKPLAHYLKVTPAYLYQVLSGFSKMSPRVEAELLQLLSELTEETGEVNHA